ncbi:hypothetical protein PIB30_038688 [Stylosanthes scabra]|uniref:Uncharacterized protein n=1 Tax=Stylosanthes scabra TaxID=79078 RepID=A0ABU6ZCT4_9FABA|nr:hypothetical protein [Stylosanthes scabra]
MRRDLAHPDAAEGDVPERNVRPRTDVGSSSQAPREARETSQSQPNYMEILLKSFEALQARVDEGFLESVGEIPPTAEPTAEVPTTDPRVADEIVTVEVTRTDDPAAEDVTEVAPAVADQGEDVQTATETTEVVQVAVDSMEAAQEHSVETPAQD